MRVAKKQFFTVGVIVLCALIVSAFMMYIALDHNPMGEFLEYQDQAPDRVGEIQWLHLLDLGWLWFVFSFLFFGVIVVLIKAIHKVLSR